MGAAATTLQIRICVELGSGAACAGPAVSRNSWLAIGTWSNRGNRDRAYCLGYAEIAFEGNVKHRYNTSVLVNRAGDIAGKYRKVHLPGHKDHEPQRPFQHLEKRYFEPGDLGFPVYGVDGASIGMFICNDRRWPETWRVMGLKGAELICGGFNTPTDNPPVPQHDHLNSFHHLLSMQAGAYQNGVWAAAAAKAELEEGCMLLGHSCIVAPTGEIVALSSTIEDEVITAACDLNRSHEIAITSSTSSSTGSRSTTALSRKCRRRGGCGDYHASSSLVGGEFGQPEVLRSPGLVAGLSHTTAPLARTGEPPSIIPSPPAGARLIGMRRGGHQQSHKER